MIVFPAMDLWDGDVVKLEPKRHREVEIVYGRPDQVAERWLGAGAEWLHVVDLNASIGEGRPNDAALGVILDRARARGARVQFGGGVRDAKRLADVAAMGVDRVIIGTKVFDSWDWLVAEAAKHPGRILVSIDGRGREILIKGWQASAGVDAVEFVRRAQELPIAGFLYTNVAVEGRLQGVDWGPVEAVVQAARKPVVFSGGVTSLDDVARFKSLGAHGIIAGSALYQGRFDYPSAKKIAT